MTGQSVLFHESLIDFYRSGGKIFIFLCSSCIFLGSAPPIVHVYPRVSNSVTAHVCNCGVVKSPSKTRTAVFKLFRQEAKQKTISHRHREGRDQPPPAAIPYNHRINNWKFFVSANNLL